jgi:hypothetical protein
VRSRPTEAAAADLGDARISRVSALKKYFSLAKKTKEKREKILRDDQQSTLRARGSLNAATSHLGPAPASCVGYVPTFYIPIFFLIYAGL